MTIDRAFREEVQSETRSPDPCHVEDYSISLDIDDAVRSAPFSLPSNFFDVHDELLSDVHDVRSARFSLSSTTSMFDASPDFYDVLSNRFDCSMLLMCCFHFSQVRLE